MEIKKIMYLAKLFTKDEFITAIDNCKKILVIDKTDNNALTACRQKEIEQMQDLLNNFDNIAKLYNDKNIDNNAINFLLNEGFDEDGNEYRSAAEYPNQPKLKISNAPWQKGDDLNN